MQNTLLEQKTEPSGTLLMINETNEVCATFVRTFLEFPLTITSLEVHILGTRLVFRELQGYGYPREEMPLPNGS